MSDEIYLVIEQSYEHEDILKSFLSLEEAEQYLDEIVQGWLKDQGHPFFIKGVELGGNR